MTVASLWKVLDDAGCGVAVGANELMNPNQSRLDLINPWNYNEANRESLPSQRPVLAVDLSIWICEALTSQAMAANHTNPALHLAFTRTMKLLGMGIKVVIVIEGKRRVRRTEEPDSFRKRRTGTAFWKACKSCEGMFECMGVPVVKAKAEGEALCALLNLRGVVDGVISNDGDCLLFGAKVVYTKFSIENLQNAEVIRYESSGLAAIVEEENDESRTAADRGKIVLSRHDLVSFALLTGSDLAGNGLPKIGHKKAVRFIYKCKHDHPLSTETAAIDELRSWARTAGVMQEFGCVEIGVKEGRVRCCTTCSHPGDKRSHLKGGCETCGTEPGEPCFDFTGSDRFRQSLRAKALALQPSFAPAMVVDSYLRPNDNSIPLVLEGITAATLEMKMPRIQAFLALKLIVKGQSHATSREYVMESLSRLLVRRSLFGDLRTTLAAPQKRCFSKEVPLPIAITRQLVRDKAQCFEVSWRVSATVTDSDGNGIDGYEFSTIEPKDVIKKQFPDLVSRYREAEVERLKQGNAERDKRKDFIETFLLCKTDHDPDDESKHARKQAGKKKRHLGCFFEGQRGKRSPNRKRARLDIAETDEMKALMRPFGEVKRMASDDFDYSTIASGSIAFDICGPANKTRKQYGRSKIRHFDAEPLGMSIVVNSSTDQNCVEKHVDGDDVADYKSSANQNTLDRRPDEHDAVLILPTMHSRQDACFKTSHVLQLPPPSLSHVGERDKADLSCPDHIYHQLGRSYERKEHVLPTCMQPQVVEGYKMSSKHGNAERITLQRKSLDSLGGIVSCEPFSKPATVGGTPDLTVEKSRRPESLTSSRAKQRIGRCPPDAWMDSVVVEEMLAVVSDSRVVRRLDFDDVHLSPECVRGSTKIPSLSSGRRHLIVCDMGIQISVSPLLARGPIRP